MPVPSSVRMQTSAYIQERPLRRPHPPKDTTETENVARGKEDQVLEELKESIRHQAEEQRRDKAKDRERMDALEDVVQEVYGQVETTRQADRNNRIFQRAISESIAIGREIPDSDYGYRTTAWQALQAIQGYEQHTASRRGNPGTNARAWMVQGNRHVSRAERVVAA